MFKWLLPFLLFVSSALAQTCPTRPPGTNDNSCASTAFVNQNAIAPALTSGDLFVGNASNLAAAQALSGDCTITNAGVITCTKTNGVAFATSATTDATNASNISSGTLANGRLTGVQNTVKGAATSAVETDLSVSSCSTANSGLQWTTNTGFGCRTSLADLQTNDQTLAGGANVTSLSQSTGNITVDCGARPLQFITNGGAFTITAPTNDGSCMLLVTNNGTAGATSLSGFSPTTCGGDAVTTTNTSKFFYSIVRINGVSTCMVRAGQ